MSPFTTKFLLFVLPVKFFYLFQDYSPPTGLVIMTALWEAKGMKQQLQSYDQHD